MIYIIKFEPSFHHAQYYLGFSDNVQKRFADHCAGNGATITREALKQGHTLRLVAIMAGDRTEERRLKNQKNTPRLVKRLQALKRGYNYVT